MGNYYMIYRNVEGKEDAEADYVFAFSPKDALRQYLYRNNLWEDVDKLKKQINDKLVENAGRGIRDQDFAVAKEKYPISVVKQVREEYIEAGWIVQLIDNVETQIQNVWGLRFTR